MSYRGDRRRSGGGGGGGSGRRDKSTSLFVRNVHFETAPEDLRKLFSRYGYVRDVYIPLDYYTKEPRGFAYVEFEDDRHAKDAMEELDGHRLHNRELEVVFAEGDRKNPNMMRRKEMSNPRYGSGYGRGRSRSRSRSPRRSRRSRSPRRSRHSSERRRSRSRSASRSGRSASRSPSGSPRRRSSRKHHSQSRSRSPRSGEEDRASKSASRSPSRSKSR